MTGAGSETLKQQEASNTREQFANSSDLNNDLDAQTTMGTRALNSKQLAIRDILLNHSRLYESLRAPGL